MKIWRLLLIVVLVAGLVLALAGCGSQDQAEPSAGEPGAGEPSETEAVPEPTVVSAAEPTEAEAPEPTEAAEPTEAPAASPETEPTDPDDSELDVTTMASADSYTSYRSTMQMIARGTRDGVEVEETLEVFTEVTTDPPVQHVTMTGTGLGELEETGFDSIEIYQTEDTMYMKMGEEWLSVPTEESEFLEEGLFTPETFTEDTCGWKKERDTEVLGVKVRHYSVDRDRLEKCATPTMSEEMSGIAVFDGDLYVSVEGDYLIQMDMYYEGSNVSFIMASSEEESLADGSVEIHIQYTDINEPFTIEVPEEALASSGAPEDIPVPPDATGQSNMFGMFTFQSALTPVELSDFYKAEMPDYGWTEDSAEEFGGMYTLSFIKDGRTASFMISGDAETGVSQVLITIEEE